MTLLTRWDSDPNQETNFILHQKLRNQKCVEVQARHVPMQRTSWGDYFFSLGAFQPYLMFCTIVVFPLSYLVLHFISLLFHDFMQPFLWWLDCMVNICIHGLDLHLCFGKPYCVYWAALSTKKSIDKYGDVYHRPPL